MRHTAGVKSAALGGALIFMVLCLAAPAANAAQDFKAEYTLQQGKKTTAGVIRAQQGKYRLDLGAGKKRLRVIADPAANLTVVAFMRKKQFRVVPSQDDKDARYDPFTSARLEMMRYIPISAGREKLLEYQTEKTEYQKSGETQLTIWQAPDLGFPIKIVSGNTLTPRYTLQLSEIEKRTFTGDIFALPQGFTPKPEKVKKAKRAGKKKVRPKKPEPKTSKQSGGEE